MKLRIGDRVSFLNEKGEGIITRIKDKTSVFVEIEDGFEIPYLIKELVPIHTELILNPEVENINIVPDKTLMDAVYFVIEPDHELPILVSDYMFYLYNASGYNMTYTYSIKDEPYYQTLKHGELGAYQKVLLKQVKKNFFKEYVYHKIEGLFFKNTHYGAQLPIVEILSVNEHVLKENRLVQHDEFAKPVYVFLLKDDFNSEQLIHQRVSKEDLEKLKQLKEFKQEQRFSKPNKTKKLLEKEVDLHIEELLDSYKGLTNGQILKIQLDEFEYELENALVNGIKKLIFIHGVGNGKLKQEIISLLKNKEGVRYFDASYKKYGFGATQVEID